MRFYIEMHVKFDILPSHHRHYISVKLVDNILIFIKLTLRHLYFQKIISARVHARTLYRQK